MAKKIKKRKEMFKKILIANRGEIACRVIRTAKKMDLSTVAIYSESDTNSLHVQIADEAINVGPAPSPKSYLNIEKVVDAVLVSGAEAVHPGYGFLSENPDFAAALEKENIIFIGPNSKSIEMMGDKIAAKKLANEAGVTTVPGYIGEIENVKEAIKISKKIGFPIMIKAAAGGGGKGIRIVKNEKDMAQAFESARNEAQNSFSDDRIFIEKFIENPRHIEIQVLADQYGNVVCLGERECSIQRHHQKVIEEAPSPYLLPETRKKMFNQVKALVKAAGYYSAGTVEFIADQNQNFYFMEMNTRLQVEHCVTEQVTGIDLVEQMIKIAAGEKLAFTQEDIKLNGWSIEARICAEDPSMGFLPSSGRITQYREPELSPNVRVDSGVYEGGEVSMFYDSMIAKLITYGNTRNEAVTNMQKALGEFVIEGVSHNISFLEAIMGNQRFIDGRLSTNFIADEYPDGFISAELTDEKNKIFLATAMYIHMENEKRFANISGQLKNHNKQVSTRWVVKIDKDSYPVTVNAQNNSYKIRFENRRIVVRSNWIIGSNLLQGFIDGEPVSVRIKYTNGGYYLTYRGTTVKAMIQNPVIAELYKFMLDKSSLHRKPQLDAPMAGVVVAIKVSPGDEVKAGQQLVSISAMKMENMLTADHDLKIGSIHVKEGESVAAGQILLEFIE